MNYELVVIPQTFEAGKMLTAPEISIEGEKNMAIQLLINCLTRMRLPVPEWKAEKTGVSVAICFYLFASVA